MFFDSQTVTVAVKYVGHFSERVLLYADISIGGDKSKPMTGSYSVLRVPGARRARGHEHGGNCSYKYSVKISYTSNIFLSKNVIYDMNFIVRGFSIFVLCISALFILSLEMNRRFVFFLVCDNIAAEL